MHLEILVEDISGKTALDLLIPKIATGAITYRVHSYKGIGHIPRNMRDTRDPTKRILLENLPKLLKGYGRAFSGYGSTYRAAVIIVCDLDHRDFFQFLSELNSIYEACDPSPTTHFCLAIEEGEAWFLGDIQAVLKAYPHAKRDVLDAYANDSICGTWELLAEAVYPGGARALSQKGFQAVGAEKSKWAERIVPEMEVNQNNSPSFAFFVRTVRGLANG